MYDWKFLMVFPQIGILWFSDVINIEWSNGGWLPFAFSGASLFICILFMLPLIGLKENEINEYKRVGMSGFVAYLVANSIYFFVLYFYRDTIRDMDSIYFVISLFFIQTIIYVFWLSNLYPPKKDSTENSSED